MNNNNFYINVKYTIHAYTIFVKMSYKTCVFFIINLMFQIFCHVLAECFIYVTQQFK